MRFLCVCLCCWAWFLPGTMLSRSLLAQEALEPLMAGAFAQEITPQKLPISINGNMADQQAASVHDPLHARCIVLKSGDTSLVIVICDSCAIPRTLIDEAKVLASSKTGIPVANMLVAATHAHSCPTVAPLFQSEPDVDYSSYLVEQIAFTIERANSQLEPARIGWGSVKEISLLFNRRWFVAGEQKLENPFGTKGDRILTNPGFGNSKVAASVNRVDPDVSFVSIQSLDKRPIALLANYSLHYIGGVPPNVISADYFGEFSNRIATQMKATDVQPPFVAMMSNGTSADVNNVDFRLATAPQREPFEQIEFASEVLARAVAKACEKLQYHESIPLRMRQQEIVMGVRKPTADDVKSAQKILDSITERPLKDLSAIYARETVLLGDYGTSVRIKLQAMRIGSLAIVACPCEVFTETGLEIKRRSPFKPTFTISLANGYNGYLPPPEQQLLGGYETWRARSSYLSADSEPKIVMTIKQMLSELK